MSPNKFGNFAQPPKNCATCSNKFSPYQIFKKGGTPEVLCPSCKKKSSKNKKKKKG